MNPDEYKFLFELEERHWWFVGMRKIVAALLDGALPAEPLRVLDAGCGTGLMLSWLRRYAGEGQIYGLDYSAAALRFSARRGERLLVQGSIAAIPFPDACFDLVTSFDVLDSFAAQDAGAPCGELARVLKPGGALLVRVPAYQFLYGRHDRAVHTKHRYTAAEMKRRLEHEGLTVVRLTYANTLLFPVAVVWRMLTRAEHGEPQSDVRPLPGLIRWLNSVLVGLLTLEAASLRVLRLPIGLSMMALARKPGKAVGM